ncbi:MAG: DMT family transporter [Bacillota bacterium]
MIAAARGVSNSEYGRSMFLLVITALMWSMGGMLIKWVDWHPIAIAGMRSAIASVVLIAICRRPRFTWSFAQIGGAVSCAATLILFVMATKMSTAANAVLLQYSAPIYVALFAVWFLGERTTRLDWITILAVMLGMVMFFLDDLRPGYFWGNILAILSGISFAALVMFMRKQKDGSPVETVILGNILTALLALPFMFGSAPSAAGWAGLGLLGVFQLGLPYVLYSRAIKHVKALEATLIPVIEPIMNPIWVFIAIGEVPGPWALLGGAIVLVSVTARCLLSLGRAKAAAETGHLAQEQCGVS